MILLIRRGYGADLALFLIVTLIIGAGAAMGVAFAIDAAFGDAVARLIGRAGEYDVIVHLREEAADGAVEVLEGLLTSRWPGVTLRRGVTVAGNDNVLVTFPPEFRRADVFEELPGVLADVTGYNGHTWMVEPSLTVSGVRPAFAEQLRPQLNAIPGVQFAFRHGSHMTVVLHHAAAAPDVAEAIEHILARHQVAEVRFPQGGNAPTQAQEFWDSLPASVQKSWVDMSAGDGAPAGSDQLVWDVARLVDLYAPRVYVPADAEVAVGDRIVLPGGAADVIGPGLSLDDLPREAAPYVVVEVTAAGADGLLGRIVHGSVRNLAQVAPGRFAEPGFRLEGRRVGAPVGTVTVESVRDALETAAVEAADTMDRIEALASRMESLTAVTLDTLSRWVEALLDVENVQNQWRGVQALLNGEEGAASRRAAAALALSLLARDGRVPVDDVLGAVGSMENGDASSLMGLDGLLAQGEGDDGAPGDEPSLQWVKNELEALRRQVEALADDDLASLVERARALPRHVPAATDEAMLDTLRRLDAYTGGRDGWGQPMELLVPAGLDADAIAKVIGQAAGTAPWVTTFEAGILNPNPRTSLLHVLEQVRHILAGVVALALAGFVLWADGSVLLHGAAMLHRLPGSHPGAAGRARGTSGKLSGAAPYGWGALFGLIIVGGLYHLAGGGIPGLNTPTVLALGAGLGVLTAAWAHRIAPIREDEVVAAAACGLTPADIMREVIVPEGRPGMLTLINRRRGHGRGGRAAYGAH